MNSKSRTALAVAATTGVAAIALLAVLRSDSARGARGSRSKACLDLQRWDYEGGNIPEVSISSGEQGSTSDPDERIH